MKSAEVLKLVGAIGLCEGAGLFSSLFTTASIATWYVALSKPSWTPPNWLFGPVWLSLYALMGASLYLFATSDEDGITVGLGVFGVQLLLNILWSVVFFGYHFIDYGFYTIVALWVSILVMIWFFAKASKVAAVMLIPYIVWVTIAAALNFSILVLNG